MINIKIGYIQLINNINWPIRVLSTYEIVKKTLKKGKNNILYIYLGYIDKTNSKKIVLMIDDINSDIIKICFYELCISAKITQNLSTKFMLEVNTK